MIIIQIVPQLPPVVNGLGDYGLALARQLHQDFGIITSFVVGDPQWQGKVEIEGFPIKQITKRSAKNLISALTELSPHPVPVLLHYVNYGYAQRGCPFWLIEGLRQWRLKKGSGSLSTMFHEIYATGFPFWTSAFWTEPSQRYLSASLIRISERIFTNKPGYAEMLRKLNLCKQLQIPVFPVFSNIGEPKKILPLAVRQPKLVVFGQLGRIKVYEQSISALQRVCRELSIQEIIDIGPSASLPISEVDQIPIISLGKQPAEKISTILQDSWVGFFHYPLDCLTRSGTFAAYCAHGVIPVGINYYDKEREDDGLEVNQHYWLADTQTEKLNLSVGQVIANQAYAWYQTHNLKIQAAMFMKHIFNDTKAYV